MPRGSRGYIRACVAAWCTGALVLAMAAWGWAAEPVYPQLTGRVVDEAGILDDTTIAELTELLAGHEKATGNQVVVVTLKSLQGLTIEDFGYQLGRHWEIGQKDKNTGALLIVAPNEHKVRIEVGYGLEGTLTDATSRVIIERDILPSFRSGDIKGGIVAGTKSILRVLGGEPGTSAAETSEQQLNKAPYIPWATIILVCVLLYLQFRARRSGGSSLMRRIGRSGGYIGYPGGFGGGFGSGGGGGGFSGGGGSFGGGGASGSW